MSITLTPLFKIVLYRYDYTDVFDMGIVAITIANTKLALRGLANIAQFTL